LRGVNGRTGKADVTCQAISRRLKAACKKSGKRVEKKRKSKQRSGERISWRWEGRKKGGQGSREDELALSACLPSKIGEPKDRSQGKRRQGHSFVLWEEQGTLKKRKAPKTNSRKP